MKLIPLKNLTVRLSVTLIEAVEDCAEARGVTVSELVRSALQDATDLDPAASRHASLLFETAKNRALFLRFLETERDAGEVEKMLALAEEDAKEYTRERLGEQR
jgi:hypothetical protein